MELPSSTSAAGTSGQLHTNKGAAKPNVLNEHDTRRQVLTPKVAHRPRQRVPCLLSHFLIARKRMRPLVCSASGAVFPTRRHQRHSRMLQEVVPSTRDEHHEGTGTFASTFVLHDRLLHLEVAVAKLSSDGRLLGHGV